MAVLASTYKNTRLKAPKKRKMNRFMMGILMTSVIILAAGIYVVNWAFFDMGRLPAGEYLTEEISPDGRFTLKAYVTNGGATTSYAIRGELVFNKEEKKKRNIYWNCREETANISWTDNNTVVINGHSLKVPDEKFDFRNQ